MVLSLFLSVATVPIVYGIETQQSLLVKLDLTFWLQQRLPFTVLKQGCIQ